MMTKQEKKQSASVSVSPCLPQTQSLIRQSLQNPLKTQHKPPVLLFYLWAQACSTSAIVFGASWDRIRGPPPSWITTSSSILTPRPRKRFGTSSLSSEMYNPTIMIGSESVKFWPYSLVMTGYRWKASETCWRFKNLIEKILDYHDDTANTSADKRVLPGSMVIAIPGWRGCERDSSGVSWTSMPR